jgi:hypothetical protein
MSIDKQYNQFAGNLNPTGNSRLEILDIERAGDELKIVVGTSEPRRAQTCFHFRGVIDFDAFIFGGEEGYSLPQYLNSFMNSARPHYEAMYKWELLGDGTEWSFIAPYPEIILL